MAQRRDTAANWTSANPTLLAGEIGIESDTNKIKIGTGSTAWTSLTYRPWSQLSAYPIVNADIASAAGISYSKLATLSNGNIVLGNSANIATSTTVSGDVTISDTGVTAIASGVIVNADINASAAIVDTKLATISTAGKVSNSATTATDVNTASAIVARDASGNFTAGTITAALTGAASSNVLKAGDTMTGVLAVTAGTAALPAITPSGDPNTGIYSPGADQLAISTNGTSRLSVDASGNVAVDTNVLYVDATNNRVGVGTITPSKKLHVSTTSSTAYNSTDFDQDYLALRLTNTTDDKAVGMLFNVGTNGDAAITAIETSDGETAFAFGTRIGGVRGEKMRLTAGGLLGLGTSAPLGPLTVGTPVADLAVQTGFFAGNKSSYASSIYNLHQNQLCVYDSTTGNAAGVGGAVVLAADCGSSQKTWLASVEAYKENATAGNYSGAMVFRTRTNGDATMYERLRITSGGLVGIGTTSPDQSLVANGGLSVIGAGNFTGTNPSGIYLSYDSGNLGTIGARSIGTASSLVFKYSTTGSFAEGMRIDTSGRLLVGTSSARDNFFNAASGNAWQFQVEGTDYKNSCASFTSNTTSTGDGPHLILARSRGPAVGSNAIVSSASGGDSLGLISFQGADGSKFVQGAKIEALVDGTPGANDMPGRLVFSTTADGAASPTERMRIKSTGDVVIVASSPATPTPDVETTGFYSDSNYSAILQFRTSLTTNKSHVIFRNGNGQVGTISTNASATSYATSSDYRLKENVEPITGATARLQKLKPSRFNFIVDPGHTVDGFIAHEAQAVVPEAITGTKDAVDDDGNPIYQGIDQSKLVPLLTAALQEAIAKIEALETRLSALEGK
jgi:hypothetical protein